MGDMAVYFNVFLLTAKHNNIRRIVCDRQMASFQETKWYTVTSNKNLPKESTLKNKFFTDKFVLTPKFAGVGSMEDYYDTKTEFDHDYD